MFGLQNYLNRNYFKTSKFQNQGQSCGMNQHSHGYGMHQDDHHSYDMHQRRSHDYYNRIQHHNPHGYPGRPSDACYSNHQRHFGSGMPSTNYRSYHNKAPGGFHSSNNMKHAGPSQHFRAIRGPTFESSLYPHGDPSPQDWLDSWDQRPECPRTKWTYSDDSTSQAAVTGDSKENSKPDVIEAKNEAILTTSYDGLTDFYQHLRPQPWQLVSPMDPDAKMIAKIVSEDYGRSDSSDSSSVKSLKSESSAIFDISLFD